MSDKFVVRPKKIDKKEDRSVVMTLRMDRELQQKFDKLAAQSDRSRNEVMCMALQYALDHLGLSRKKNQKMNNMIKEM